MGSDVEAKVVLGKCLVKSKADEGMFGNDVS